MTFSFPDYLLLFVALFNFILSGFILVNNPRNRVNIIFTVYAFFLTAWSVLLLIFRNVSIDFASIFMRAIYVSGLGIAITLWHLVRFFPQQEKEDSTFYSWPFLFLELTVAASMMIPGWIVVKTVLLADGSRSVLLNPLGYWVFFATFFLYYGSALGKFAYRLTKTDGLLKQQSRLILVGTTIAVIFGGYFNIILPSPFFKNFHYIHWGPFFTLAIVLLVAYAVAKYQFMNIKALVTELYAIALFLIMAFNFISPDFLSSIYFRLGLLASILIFSYLLIRSVLKEVERREQITMLAHELQEANLQLQELDRQKTDFLSIASHQLRTPLSILNGYIGLLQEGGYGRPTKDMRGIFRNMDESNTRLIKLVDEFLDITRIEQGRTKFYFSSHDMNDLVTGVVKELTPRAEKKKMKLVWEPTAKPQMVSIDDDKIRHAVFNFIDNAIKYSEIGDIVIQVKNRDKGLVFTVNDQGVGFDEKDRVNFFQKFYRGENVQGTNVTGTGLGLYVVSKFVEAHGGKVWAKSPGLGKGSEFGLWLPFSREDGKADVSI
jgi:signal transduction histidine kinase